MAAYLRDKEIYNQLQLRYGIVGDSPPMQEVIQLLMQAAPTELAILITGETGTGKEVFANAVHGLSSRKKFPFVSVNCGAIPETLLESELFGHEKGAFTGANDQRKGFFEAAHRGTIFLDEIGEMPIGTQVKLLRILESGEYSRLGSSSIHKVDVRLIAATNRNLETHIQQGSFRQDLYFRLKSVHIALPALRNHSEDVPALVDFFAWQVCDKLSMHFDGISPDALNILKTLPWPGNIRELKNLIETIVTLEKAAYITTDTIRKYIPPALPAPVFEYIPPDKSLVRTPEKDESQMFEMGLIFRSLIELQNDVADIKNMIRTLGLSIDNVRREVRDINSVPAAVYYPAEESPAEEFYNLKLEDMERKLIEVALKKYDNNRRQAAEALGISERTLYRKIQDFNIS